MGHRRSLSSATVTMMLLVATPAAATEVELSANVGLLVGQLSYGLEFSQYVPSVRADVTAGSRLTYPLNMMLVGVEASLGGGPAGDRRWELVLSVATNPTHPFGSMSDSDYLIDAQGSEVEFSYTESSLEARALLADLGARVRLARWRRAGRVIALELRAGYHHQFVYADVYGASGWVLESPTSRRSVSLPDGTHAIHFDTHQVMPYVGLGLRARWGGRFSVAAETRALAVISVTFDEHVLRNKDAHGLAGGPGLLVGVRPLWRLTDPTARAVLSVGASAELLLTYAAVGTLEQAYHADDPSLPGDQSGLALPDVDFWTTNVQLSLLATAQLRF